MELSRVFAEHTQWRRMTITSVLKRQRQKDHLLSYIVSSKLAWAKKRP